MPSQRTWITVLGRETGRLFSHRAPGEALELVETFDFSHRDDRAADAPGRVHERVGQARHSMEPPDLAEAARTRMADTVSEALARGVDDGHYDRLFVVAAPDTLGALRDQLETRVRDRLVGEMNKNLDNADVRTIAEHLDRDGTLGKVAASSRAS